MARDFDLLGHPIPDNHGEVGRTGHVVTPENVNKVRSLVIAGWTARAIAEEIGVTGPTLTKHYLNSRPVREAKRRALSEAKATVLVQLSAAAAKGNVTAIKEMHRIVEKEELAIVGRELSSPKKKSGPKLGKKEQREFDAAQPDDKWGFAMGGGAAKH